MENHGSLTESALLQIVVSTETAQKTLIYQVDTVVLRTTCNKLQASP